MKLLDVQCEQGLQTAVDGLPDDGAKFRGLWARSGSKVRHRASARYQSISCSCRTALNAANIGPVDSGFSRQLVPPKSPWDTFWPAPKQSKTVQPRNPLGRRLLWMVQEKSAARFGQGVPAGLSSANSAERENPKAVQQRAKQFPQSGSRDCRSRAGAECAAGWAEFVCMWSSRSLIPDYSRHSRSGQGRLTLPAAGGPAKA
jgi:hypothetical protein